MARTKHAARDNIGGVGKSPRKKAAIKSAPPNNAKKDKPRRKPLTLAKQQIKKYRSTINPSGMVNRIPMAPFKRVVRNIMDNTQQGMRISQEAIEMAREDNEAVMLTKLKNAMLIARHCNPKKLSIDTADLLLNKILGCTGKPTIFERYEYA